MANDFDVDVTDSVQDKCARARPGEDIDRLIVVSVHGDVRADEWVITDDGETLHSVVGDWRPSEQSLRIKLGVEEEYTPESDGVVEVLFFESLDYKFGPDWYDWSVEKLLRLCEKNDVQTYSYHMTRLEPYRKE